MPDVVTQATDIEEFRFALPHVNANATCGCRPHTTAAMTPSTMIFTGL